MIDDFHSDDLWINRIRTAHVALRGRVVRTPLLTFPALNALVGGRIYLKPENLQHTGSFKYRGALNHIRMLEGSNSPKPVIAYSSGNHAQGVAKAAQDANIPATIVMPADAPKTKIEGTQALGAKVVLYDREKENREQVAASLPNAHTAYLIPPYDHPLTIAGQGTIGLEVAEQMGDETLDQALICCGGGGLATGVVAALYNRFPKLQAYTCEPDGFDDFKKSLMARKIVKNTNQSGSICDAILTPAPGNLTFALAQSLPMQGLTVSDDEALDAVAYAAQNLRLIVEPGGAVALAAALFGKINLTGKSTLVVLSGGNIDRDLLMSALDRKLLIPTAK